MRAVRANSGAKVRCGSELQLAQGGSFLAIAWEDKCVMFEERRDTNVQSVCHLHFVCMEMSDWKG